MRGNYIDFISAYCDRWCERCAFTDRCSAYAVKIATEMCGGDFSAGLELAVGAPPPATEAERRRREAFLEELENIELTPEDEAQFAREKEERDARVQELPIVTTSELTWLLSHRWLRDNREQMSEIADAALADAIEVASWDTFLIHAKLRRALDGRDEAQHGRGFDDHPIQNDWNGSAKVALISIERSTIAWDAIARATGDPDAAQVAAHLRTLAQKLERAFPDVRKFTRPGFDGIPRRRRRRRR